MSFSAVNPDPPRAQRRPTDRCFHGDHFEDPYEWMRNREDPATKAYVRDQNRYCRERLAGQEGLRATLLKEFTDRVQQTDMSVPTRMHGYWYFSRTLKGQEYGVQCRLPVRDQDDWDPPTVQVSSAPGSMPGEEVIFDANAEAKGHDYFSLGCLDLSADGRWMLYGLDTRGNERYDLR
ncbi:MAG: S9 family peptidase, partial [Bifidobacterium sp.]|nr:S9 family peptidase [Bifidobacterium sp.]